MILTGIEIANLLISVVKNGAPVVREWLTQNARDHGLTQAEIDAKLAELDADATSSAYRRNKDVDVAEGGDRVEADIPTDTGGAPAEPPILDETGSGLPGGGG